MNMNEQETQTIAAIRDQIQILEKLNPGIKKTTPPRRSHTLQKVLIANRGEIAKRFFLSLKEEGIRSVAVVTDPDKGQTWYEMADEVVMIGGSANYTAIPGIIGAALLTGANAIYPGYGFLSENPDFVEAIHLANRVLKGELIDDPILFMGPDSTIMRRVGNKLDARKLAKEFGVPLFEGTEDISDIPHAEREASRVGYPVIVKLNAGGGGKGMQAVFKQDELAAAIESCQRIGKMLYQDDTYYLEKFIVKPVHIEVQIFNGTAVGIRKCAVQRRNQKIVEESGDHFLSNHTRLALLAAAENMARISGYDKNGGAGTVEFLYDPDSDSMGFLEMNTRLQVEHPVTDQSLGIDLARWQILLFDGRESEIPYMRVLEKRFIHKDHTIECRIYAEDPENTYTPSPGKIEELDLPTFNGIRCDFGFRRGDRILPDYDPMIGKLIATAETRDEALLRMERALNELYVRGITTNQYQLLRIMRSAEFRKGDYTNRLLEEHQELSRPADDEELIREAAILGALAENIKLLRDRRDELFYNRDLEGVLYRMDLIALPESYDVEIQGRQYEARFLQTGLNTFYTYINTVFQGEVELLPALSGESDYTFRFEYRSCPVRVDRRPSIQIIRFPDSTGRIHFLKLKVIAKGAQGGRDPEGMVRSPIQGTFVKFQAREGKPLARGMKVKKGDAIIVLSAMKMETTITATVDGTVTYLIEDGDLSRLELGRTGDQRIIGRPITEGEVLFVIDAGKTAAPAGRPGTATNIKQAPLPEGVSECYLHLFSDRFLEMASKNPDDCLPVILELGHLLFAGFNIESKELIGNMTEVLKHLPDDYDLSRMAPEAMFLNILAVFAERKRIFSPLHGGNVSYFRETYRMFSRWGDVSYQLPSPYKFSVQSVFQSFGVADWRSTAEYEKGQAEMAFLFVLRSFHSTRDFSEIVRSVLTHASHFRHPSIKLKNVLRKLVIQEEAEQDYSLAGQAADTLSRMGVRSWNMEMTYWVSRKYLPDLRKMKNDPLSFAGIEHDALRKNIESALASPSADLIPSGLNRVLQEELVSKIEALKARHAIKRLYSPTENVLIYLVGEGDDARYFTFGLVERLDPLRDASGRIVGSENAERMDIEAVRVLHAYQSIQYRRGNIVDLIIADDSVTLDLARQSDSTYSYPVMMNMLQKIVPFFNDPGIENNIMSIRARKADGKTTVRKRIFATSNKGRIVLNLLADNDPRNPYNTAAVDPKTTHVFNLGKWPAELWIEECFDPGSASELFLPSIDGPEGKRVPVGSRVHVGQIRGNGAVFYFKDSRISGGATGDLEGRKYVVACWIAAARGWPLYVWNDGAGANIKQGMVSLNRAGEGFFMNGLIGARLSPAEIYAQICRHDDPVMKEGVDEATKILGLEGALKTAPAVSAWIVAVGVGSSTGLDVYGSSQAAIQVMVDDEQSYRVLTGSAVIKSVTGEDLTNYEIGGARVMNRVTGTVDRVARSNLQLLTLIHELHDLFQRGPVANSIDRPEPTVSTKPSDPDDVLTPEIVRSNVDQGSFMQFKEEYYGSGALTGGFARMGGNPVLVMGPRSNMGLRSFASLTRACELLIEARKLGANQIIVIGDEWFSETPRTDAATLRTRQEFLKLTSVKSGLRIHIALTVNGLRKIMLHSFADALIFVRSGEYSERDEDVIRNASTHSVGSIEEAFDLALRIMNLFQPGDAKVAARGVPSLPAETTQPFDVIKSVIEPCFDPDTFVEWWGGMNDPKRGPSLVTGFARLAGSPVAILADQPAIMGGAPDAPGTEKYRFFTEMAERCQIPIIMLSNAPGFVPGTRQERLRIQQIGGRSLDVNVLSTVPVVCVTLQQNYGGRQIHAFSKFLRTGIVSFALKGTIMAVMGGSSAFDLFHGKKYAELQAAGNTAEAEKLRQTFIDDFSQKARAGNDALATGIIDLVIESVTELRATMIKCMELSRERNR